jgi:trans-aconitate methyltransferase
VDALLDRGFCAITVLDIAEAALEVARRRLGPRGQAVDWQVADIRRWRPEGPYDLWHDRAVFHFLTEPEDRAAYMATLNEAVRPGGWVVLASFAPDGPETCSGLPVRRYDAAGLAEELGEGFELVRQMRERHVTPSGAEQPFTWTLFRRR